MAMNEPTPRLRRQPVTGPVGLDSLGAFATDPFTNLVLSLQDPIFFGAGPEVFNALVRQAHTAPVLPGVNTLSPLPFSDAAMAQMFVESMLGPRDITVETEERTRKRSRRRNRERRGINTRSAANRGANLSRR